MDENSINWMFRIVLVVAGVLIIVSLLVFGYVFVAYSKTPLFDFITAVFG